MPDTLLILATLLDSVTPQATRANRLTGPSTSDPNPYPYRDCDTYMKYIHKGRRLATKRVCCAKRIYCCCKEFRLKILGYPKHILAYSKHILSSLCFLFLFLLSLSLCFLLVAFFLRVCLPHSRASPPFSSNLCPSRITLFHHRLDQK